MPSTAHIARAISRKIERFSFFLAISAALSALALAQQPAQKAVPRAAKPAIASAKAPAPVATGKDAPHALGTQKLPLRRVVLYKSGVGYFEHTGRVSGNEDVEIDLTSSQLDDVLKSLTALDLSGGRIVGASYNSQEPAGHQLESLPVPVAGKTTLVELLQALRGARLEVRTSTGVLTGRLLSIQQATRRENGVEVRVNEISLLGDEGDVRSFALEPDTSLRFADRDLEQEISRALGLLDASHEEDVRHLVLSTAGTGERQIRVSYISEVPVWKTTYRIILPNQTVSANARPLLQGWAVVDNTVGEDWNDVELSLAAGAPQTFIQELSQPYYLERPTVEMPKGVLLSPQTHDSTFVSGAGSINGTVRDPDGHAISGATVRALDASNNQAGTTRTGSDGRYSFNSLPDGKYTVEISSPNFKNMRINSLEVALGHTNHLDSKLELGATSVTVEVNGGAQVLETQSASISGRSRNSTFQGLPKGNMNVTFDGINAQNNLLKASDGFFALSDPRIDEVEEFGASANSNEAFRAASRSVDAAEGGLLGDLFEYKLRDRVTIHKNQSALVPIVQTEITAEKVALWNARLGMPRPLRALWLTNSSPLVLDGGSFSVIEDGAFAGEGLIEPLHPGEKRLISYAADLAMQVVAKAEPAPGKVTHVRVARGTIIRTVESRQRMVYTVRNEDTIARTLIIEHPVRAGWKLNADLKPAEQSATSYRFKIEVAPKESKKFTVEESSPVATTVALTNLTPNVVERFVTQHEITPELEKALREILAQKDAIAKLDADLQQKNDEVDSIGDDQERLRDNLGALKGTAQEKALAERYVTELSEQETRLATLKKEIASLEAARKQAQQDLDSAIEHMEFDTVLKEE